MAIGYIENPQPPSRLHKLPALEPKTGAHFSPYSLSYLPSPPPSSAFQYHHYQQSNIPDAYTVASSCSDSDAEAEMTVDAQGKPRPDRKKYSADQKLFIMYLRTILEMDWKVARKVFNEHFPDAQRTADGITSKYYRIREEEWRLRPVRDANRFKDYNPEDKKVFWEKAMVFLGSLAEEGKGRPFWMDGQFERLYYEHVAAMRR